MTKNGDRHASVDSEGSWRSSDTVRSFRPRPPVSVRTNKDLSYQYVDPLL
jgi:hypothetical protein